MTKSVNMYLFKLTSVFLLLCYNLCLVNAFNLDTLDYVQYKGDSDSMFGFSVAAHRDRDYNWVLIGAPQANSYQPGVSNGGAVYYCPTDREEGCRLLNFDRSGNNNSSSGHQIDEKSGQWFGATVQSGGPDKPIVACAPRYLWFTLKNGRRDPVGTCYVSSSDFRDFSEFSPCRTRHWGYHRQGTCQAGLGAAVSKDGQRLFIGAPGSWYWQGQMYSIDPDAKLPFTPPRFSNYDSNYGTSAGQVYSQDMRKRPSVHFTKEGPSFDDDSYLGYSVCSGNFTGEKEAGIAAGMPRGSRLVGKVLLYNWNLTQNYKNISGSQLGAYFGYAVAAADVNGDGLDDLIVGAPLHTEPNNEGKYEIGRVYVIYPVRRDTDPNANPNSPWPRLLVNSLDGVSSKGRFGLSVSNLGDLDLDGYQDIAIGAPYSGPNGRGAVYIYYGSKKGIRSKVSQVITAEDVSQTSMYTFGFSVSGSGIDLDNNNYPDLVIGAYRSNTAFIFRAQPVINVDANISFKTANGLISLEEKNCTIDRNKRVVCTSFEACVNYNGIGVNNRISLIMEFTLDAKKSKDPRMFSYHPDRRQKFNETWILRRNDKQCKNIQVYIRENTRDKLTPMEVQMKYHLYKEESASSLTHRRDPRSALQAVLNGNSPSIYKDSINIRKNCGDDNVCIPDLRLHVKSNVDKYLLGSGKKLELDVIVKNEGEDSFESMFYMKLPPGINYFNTEKLIGSLDIPVKCSPPTEYTNNTLKCDIGNPLPKDKLVHFKVMLEPFNIEGMSPSYDFNMMVNSTNKENTATVSDNIQALTIDIWVKTNLSLTGWAQYPDIHYKENQYKESNFTSETEIGPQVVHIYSIKNNGPSDIIEAEVLFMWPSHTLGGDDLLYIMEQPETSGSIVCEKVPKLEALMYVEPLTPRKYYLESSENKAGATAGRVGLEERVTSNVGSSIGRHEERHEDDKLFDTGDASYIHVNRGKERTSSSSSSSSSGGSSSSGSSTSYRSSSSSSSSSSSGSGGGRVSGSTYESSSRGGTQESSGSRAGSGIIHESGGGRASTYETRGGSGIIHESSGGRVSGGVYESSDSRGGSGIIHESSGSRTSGGTYETRGGSGMTQESSGSRASGGTYETRGGSGIIHESSGSRASGGVYDSGSRGGETWRTRNTTTTYTQNRDGTINKQTITTTSDNNQSGGGGGSSAAGNNYKIYYTSTGNGNGDNNSHFGINQNQNESRQINYGTVHHSTHPSSSSSSSSSYRHNKYFNWNNNNNNTESDNNNNNNNNRGFIISTEESVNEGLDEYTRTVTHDRFDGNQFRTGTLDLGTMDYEKNQVSQEQEEKRMYYDPDLGSYEERSSSHGHSSVTYGGHSRPYNTQHSSSSSSVRHQHVGDNVATEHPTDIDYRNRIYRNKRRAEDDISDIVECKSTKCSMIRCKAGPLVKDEEAWTALRFRANAATLQKLGWTESVTISSMMVSRINKLPYIGTPNERPIHTHEVFTNVTYTQADIKPDVVPLWVVVLSACAGAIILLLLIFLLYKCGFFKRNRPSDVPERQPLNRNGHYQGDEQL